MNFGPLNEMLHIGCVGVATITLPPGKLTVQQAIIHRRHLCRVIVPLLFRPLRAEEGEHSARVHRRHEAPLVVEPFRIAFFGNAIADECEPRSTQRDQFV